MSASLALVTGGAGFIGSHLVERLVADGVAVRVFDDLSRGSWANLGPVAGAVECIEGDVRDGDAVDAAVRGARWVFHLAAVPSVVESVAEPVRTHAINVLGTLEVLEAARRHAVERVVLAASCAAYGEEPGLPKHEAMPAAPTSPYALQKLAAEHYCRIYARTHGVSAAVLRFFNVYGARQDPASDYAAVVPRFVRAAVEGSAVHVYGDGRQTRDFVHVADVARACVLAAHADALPALPINVASGRATSVLELIEAIGACAGRPLQVVHEAPRPGEVRHSLGDTTRAREQLGFEAQVALEQGLAATFEAFAGARPPRAGAAMGEKAR